MKQVFKTLLLLLAAGTANAQSTDTSLVRTTGNQTIHGQKTFVGGIVANKLSMGVHKVNFSINDGSGSPDQDTLRFTTPGNITFNTGLFSNSPLYEGTGTATFNINSDGFICNNQNQSTFVTNNFNVGTGTERRFTVDDAGISIHKSLFLTNIPTATGNGYKFLTIDTATGKVKNTIANFVSKTQSDTIAGIKSFTGNIGIGLMNPTERLEVAGMIRAKEVKVETANWPDYVFQKSHPKLSLKEIEAYIKEKSHLPCIPAAKEVEEKGLSLGEMNKLLLEKIEEMTLHLIELNKKLEAVEKLQNTKP